MGIVGDVKDLAKLLQDIGNIDLYKKVLDLQGEILEQVEEKQRLREDNKRLKEAFEIKDKLVFQNNAYWFPGEKELMEGPFCSNCWDRRRELVRMVQMRGFLEQCPTCKVPTPGGSVKNPKWIPPNITK